MPDKVLDPSKRVTDVVLLAHLAKHGLDADYVEFVQDYAMPAVINGKREKRKSPYAKFYRDRISGQEFVVSSGLPMVDASGAKCEPRWIQSGSAYRIKNNVFDALVNDVPGRITLTCKNDQPDGRKKNDKVVLRPQLFLGGVEAPRPSATLLAVDPLNPNYAQNTLEWDYGICKRRLRTVEGRIHGYWIFPANPGNDVVIKYNQTGDYRLKLSQYAIDNDTEFVPLSVFASATYPFTVDDSATYYPDANPESTSVDGVVGRWQGVESWATIRAGAGTNADDSAAFEDTYQFVAESNDDPNTWQQLWRSIYLFDTSPLPDGATISAATLSIYGKAKAAPGSNTPSLNIYTSTPASNTALAVGDYTQIGSTAQSTAITHANLSTTGYNDFALNDLTKISKTSVSKFGGREATYDVAGTTPGWNANANTYFETYFSEQGSGYKPKLVVTYTSVTAPTITLSAATSITDTTATLNGNVTATGGENPTVTVYWGTTDGGQTPGSWANSGAPTSPAQPQGVAAFTRNLTGLTNGTRYYFSAKATNSGGTGWPAASLSFTTAAVPTTAALTTTQYIPIIATAFTPSTQNLATTLYAPLAIVGVIPVTADLTTTGYAPSLLHVISTETTSLVTTGFAPSLALGVTPETIALSISSFAPELITALIPSTLAIRISAMEPSLLWVYQMPEPTSLALTTWPVNYDLKVNALSPLPLVLTSLAPWAGQLVVVQLTLRSRSLQVAVANRSLEMALRSRTLQLTLPERR